MSGSQGSCDDFGFCCAFVLRKFIFHLRILLKFCHKFLELRLEFLANVRIGVKLVAVFTVDLVKKTTLGLGHLIASLKRGLKAKSTEYLKYGNRI